MREEEFEGTLVLEQLATGGLLDEFWDAMDRDDFDRAESLLQCADVDAATIEAVIQEMAGG